MGDFRTVDMNVFRAMEAEIERLRAALRRIKVIGDESHENDAHCCAHEAEQALEQK
jgi:hypothetical protein